MKTLYTLAIVSLLFLLGCTGSPTAPTHEPADWPEWNIQVEGVNHTLTLDSIVDRRHVNADGDPGTTMTDVELRTYIAVNIVMANFPESYWCDVYQIFWPYLENVPRFVLDLWVIWIEFYEDVPDTPIEAIC